MLKKTIMLLGSMIIGVLIGFFVCAILWYQTSKEAAAFKDQHSYPLVSDAAINNAKAHLYYLQLIEKNDITKLKQVISNGLRENLGNAWDFNRWDGTPRRKEYAKIAKLAEYYFEAKGEPQLFNMYLLGVSKCDKMDYERFSSQPDFQWSYVP